jgi:7-keto-8-aminopelargonate synthetase-like enzyme
MGTLSKAVGCLGGFVAGSKDLIDYLCNKARSFIYTTALPPAVCASALAAFEVMESEPAIRQRLWENIGIGTEALRHLGSSKIESAIIPIIIGDTEKTMEISKKLLEKGFFVSAIRPPTVPKGESRLRITISAQHTEEEIECLASLLQQLIPA